MRTHAVNIRPTGADQSFVLPPQAKRRPRSLDGGSGGGNDGRMDDRIAELEAHAEKTNEKLVSIDARLNKLEAHAEKTNERLAGIDVRLVKIETRIDEGFKHFATKEDMQKGFNDMTWRIFAIVIVAQLLPAIPAFLKAVGWIH